MPRGRHPHLRLTDEMVRQAGPGRHADGNRLSVRQRQRGAELGSADRHGPRRDRALGSVRACRWPKLTTSRTSAVAWCARAAPPLPLASR